MHQFMLRFGTEKVVYYGCRTRAVFGFRIRHATKDEKKVRLGSLLEKTETSAITNTISVTAGARDRTGEIAEESVRPVVAVCLAGEQAVPPEDCGGIPILSQPEFKETRSREYAEIKEWMGEYDPAAFDLAAINRNSEGQAMIVQTCLRALCGLRVEA